MKSWYSRLPILLALSLSSFSTPAIGKDADDSVLMAQLEHLRKRCEQKHAENQRRVRVLESAKSDASLPPQQLQNVEEKLQLLKTAIAKTDALLATPMPTTKEARESLLNHAFAEIATTRELEATVAKNLGLPTSPLEAVLSRIGGAENFKAKVGAFDWAERAYNPDLNAPVPESGNSALFGLAGQLPPSAIPTSRVSGAYTPTTVQAAADMSVQDHGLGGGIMLEGTAGGLGTVSSVEYDATVNALLLNGDLVYFVKIPPWSLATMCRAIGMDRNALIGVSETMTEGLVFGDKPEIYKGSELAEELMLADKFLGDVIFARRNGWTEGYKFPDAPPTEGRVKSSMLVRFAFGHFEFAKHEGQLSVTGSSLEVRMIPVSNVSTPTGQMLPNYNALDNGYRPPDAFIANAGILTEHEHMDYFRHEPLIEEVFAFGETAAILRSIKESAKRIKVRGVQKEGGSQRLAALADQIETGEMR